MVEYLTWNPSREAFSLPFVHISIYWYSLWFALGFFGAVLLARHLVYKRASAISPLSPDETLLIDRYIDTLCLYSFIGLFVGARLGHIVFYDLQYYLQEPLQILNVRQGGLASHGGVIGLVLALFLVGKRSPRNPLLPHGFDLLDLVAICSAWTASCIRCGNFFNQEIIGTVTDLPWAVIFISPADGIGGLPRHPVQLYEAAISFAILAYFLCTKKAYTFAQNGRIAGWVLVITFMARCCFEFIKAPQCSVDNEGLHMGLWLSVPVILVGVFLILRANRPLA